MIELLNFNNPEFQLLNARQQRGFAHDPCVLAASNVDVLDQKIRAGVREEESHKQRCAQHLDEQSQYGNTLSQKDKESGSNITKAFNEIDKNDKSSDKDPSTTTPKSSPTPEATPNAHNLAGDLSDDKKTPRVKDVTPPVKDNQNETDLKGRYPDGTTVTGDGKTHRPLINHNPNHTGERADPPYRELPTGYGRDEAGNKTWHLRSPVPYDAKKPGGDSAFWSGTTNVYDSQDHFVGSIKLGQASMVVDPDTNTVAVIGNEAGGHGQRVMMTAPYDPADPNAWIGQLKYAGVMPPGDRENQIIRLKNGGFAFFSSADTGTTTVFTASSLQGLLADQHPYSYALYGLHARYDEPYCYGITVLDDVKSGNSDIVTVGFSTWEPVLDAHGHQVLDLHGKPIYNPHTYTSHITLTTSNK